MPESTDPIVVVEGLRAFLASDWVREIGFVLLVTLLSWPIAWLLARRLKSHETDRREVALLRGVLRASVWPLLALGLSAIGLEVLRNLRPDWLGDSAGVLPVLGFFLIFRVFDALLVELLPQSRRRRRLRKGVAPALFVLLVLQQMALLAPTVEFLRRPFAHLGDTPISVFSLMVSVAFVIGASLVGQIVQALLGHRVLPRVGIEIPIAEAIGTVVRYVLVVIGVMAGVEVLGFDLTTLKIAFGALGVGIGFGLQSVANNFISGLILLFERTVKRGDVLTVEGTDGRVQRLGLRASIIRTREGDDLIMPNSILAENMVTNYSYGDQLKRVDVPVGVSYSADPHRVREVLLDVAARCEGVLDHPEPSVLFDAFGNSSIDFFLRVWIDDPWKVPMVRSALLFDTWYALKSDGIEIPFPQRDLHLRSGVLRVAKEGESEAGG